MSVRKFKSSDLCSTYFTGETESTNGFPNTEGMLRVFLNKAVLVEKGYTPEQIEFMMSLRYFDHCETVHVYKNGKITGKGITVDPICVALADVHHGAVMGLTTNAINVITVHPDGSITASELEPKEVTKAKIIMIKEIVKKYSYESFIKMFK